MTLGARTQRLIESTAIQNLILAVVLVIFGFCREMLTFTGSDQAIIDPASGIALGVLLVQGLKLWPGIFLGYLAYQMSLLTGFDLGNITHAIISASLITLQSLLGYALYTKILGRPLEFKSFADILKVIIFIPIISLVSEPLTDFISSFLTGDIQNIDYHSWLSTMLGIFIFMPLCIFLPNAKTALKWGNNTFPALSFLSLLVLLVPIGLSFYTWKVIDHIVYEDTHSLFKSFATEAYQAIDANIASYDHLLRGAGAFINSSNEVTQEEWVIYTQSIKIDKIFPGVLGIGYIEYGPEGYAPRLLEMRKAQLKNPIIDHIKQGAILGALKRLKSIDRTTITDSFILESSEHPVFLLITPLYESKVGVSETGQEKDRLKGFLYAPFFSYELFKDVHKTHSVEGLYLEVYEGNIVKPSTMIFYDSLVEEYDKDYESEFVYSQNVETHQKTLTLLWKSTSVFSANHQSNYPFLFLISGLVFTTLFGVYIILLTIRNVSDKNIIFGQFHYLVPVLILLMASGLSFYLHNILAEREIGYIKNTVADEIDQIEKLITIKSYERFKALERMAERWEASGGTPYHQWQQDARSYITDIGGLTTLEWIDNSYKIRWIEPLRENKTLVGIDVLFDESRRKALEGSAYRHGLTLTEPIDLIQGYPGFIAYVPIYINGKFQGLIGGLFSIQGFFNDIATEKMKERYHFALEYEGRKFFFNTGNVQRSLSNIEMSGRLNILNRDWTLRVRPTQKFLQSERSQLPFIVLFATFFSGFLICLTVHYIIISRIKSINLKKSENTFRMAMENASIGMAFSGANGEFLVVNKALCELLGYSEQELLSMDIHKITHPDDLNKSISYIIKMVNGEIDTYQIEKRYFHKDGVVIWALQSVSVVRKPNGQVKHFVSQIQDISARKQMDKMKSEFISIVSHELRTPLTSIRASLGLMEADVAGKLPEKAKELVDIAYKNCERLIVLINDILDLNKLDAGKMSFNFKEVNLLELIEQGVKENKGYADKHEVAFKVMNVQDDAVVNVDPIRWQQVFSNLLSNAAKFSPKKAAVEIYTDIHGKMVRTYVKDHGPGIPDEFKKQIFKKFSQADSTSTRIKGGTGLGLHISKEIVETMKGKIGFETEKDKGTTFWFDLPLVTPTADKTEHKNKKSGLAKVLFAEDEEDFIKVICEPIKEKAEFVTVTSVSGAKTMLRQNRFSLAVIDLQMPDGSGEELISYIRDVLKDEGTRIMLLTGSELSDAITSRVDYTMVKARNTEDQIRDKILELANSEKG